MAHKISSDYLQHEDTIRAIISDIQQLDKRKKSQTSILCTSLVEALDIPRTRKFDFGFKGKMFLEEEVELSSKDIELKVKQLFDALTYAKMDADVHLHGENNDRAGAAWEHFALNTCLGIWNLYNSLTMLGLLEQGVSIMNSNTKKK